MEKQKGIARIEESTFQLLDRETRQILSEYEKVCVSGILLHLFPKDTEQKESHFSECSDFIGRVVLADAVITQRIPKFGHNHLEEQFLSDEGYPVLVCHDKENQYYVSLREGTGFEVIDV